MAHTTGKVACMVLAMFAVGCGSGNELPLGRVSGLVTYKGQPIPTGIIFFLPERGPAASAPIDAQGPAAG